MSCITLWLKALLPSCRRLLIFDARHLPRFLSSLQHSPLPLCVVQPSSSASSVPLRLSCLLKTSSEHLQQFEGSPPPWCGSSSCGVLNAPPVRKLTHLLFSRPSICLAHPPLSPWVGLMSSFHSTNIFICSLLFLEPNHNYNAKMFILVDKLSDISL